MSPELRRCLGTKQKAKNNKGLKVHSCLIAAGPERCHPESQTRYGINMRKSKLAIGPHRGCERASLFRKYSIFSSNIGDEIFSFDDEIVNSFAYRNALKRLASKTKATQQAERETRRAPHT